MCPADAPPAQSRCSCSGDRRGGVDEARRRPNILLRSLLARALAVSTIQDLRKIDCCHHILRSPYFTKAGDSSVNIQAPSNEG